MSTVALRIDPVPGRPPEGIMGCVVGDTVGNGSCQIPRRTGLHATHSRL